MRSMKGRIKTKGSKKFFIYLTSYKLHLRITLYITKLRFTIYTLQFTFLQFTYYFLQITTYSVHLQPYRNTTLHILHSHYVFTLLYICLPIQCLLRLVEVIISRRDQVSRKPAKKQPAKSK